MMSDQARNDRRPILMPSSEIRLLTEISRRATDLDHGLLIWFVAWNVLRHFYPYSTEVRVDGTAAYGPHLESVYTATTRDAEADALRGLLAVAADGHGRVIDAASETFVCRICPFGAG